MARLAGYADTPHWSRSCLAMSGVTPRGLAADQAGDGRAALRTAMAGRVLALGVGAIRDDPSVWTTARWPSSLGGPAWGP